MKGLFLNSVARIAVIGFQLVNINLYTSYLSPEQIGLFFFFLTISYFVNALLFVPIDYYQQANIVRLLEEGVGLGFLLRFNKTIATVYFSLLGVMALAVALLDVGSIVIAILVVSLPYFLYVVQALRNTLNNLGYQDVVSISFINEGLLKVGTFAFFSNVVTSSELILMLAWVVSLMFSAIHLLYAAFKHNLFRCGSEKFTVRTSELVRFAYPFSIGAICNWLQLQGYRLVLVPLGFTAEVGIFATISSIGAAGISAISLIYSHQFMPIVYKTRGGFTRNYLLGGIFLLLLVGIVVMLGGKLLVALLTSPDFEPFWTLLLYGVFTDGANILIAVLAVHLTLISETKKAITSGILGLLVASVGVGSLQMADAISPETIGIPMLVSQWVVVLYLFVSVRSSLSR